jgi:hypothetical protein
MMSPYEGNQTISSAGKPPGASLMGNSAALSQVRSMVDQMTKHSAHESPLPCPADRRKIIEQAQLVLLEAQAVVKHLDGTFYEWSAAVLSSTSRSTP